MNGIVTMYVHRHSRAADWRKSISVLSSECLWRIISWSEFHSFSRLIAREDQCVPRAVAFLREHRSQNMQTALIQFTSTMLCDAEETDCDSSAQPSVKAWNISPYILITSRFGLGPTEALWSRNDVGCKLESPNGAKRKLWLAYLS